MTSATDAPPASDAENQEVSLPNQLPTEADWVSRFADEVIAEAERRAPGQTRSSARPASARPARSTWATCARS